jgi:hypothetical protein
MAAVFFDIVLLSPRTKMRVPISFINSIDNMNEIVQGFPKRVNEVGAEIKINP